MISRKLLISFANLAAIVVALLLAPVGAESSQQIERSFTGVWRITYREMLLQQSGANVTEKPDKHEAAYLVDMAKVEALDMMGEKEKAVELQNRHV